MRILSRFHDYYDRAMAHGADHSRVFVRDTIEYSGASQDSPVPEYLSKFLGLVKGGGDHGKVRFQAFLVAFAGKLYPGIHAYVLGSGDPINGTGNTVSEFFYDQESFLAFAEQYNVNLDRKYFMDQQTAAQRYASFFALKGSTAEAATFAEHGIAMAIATRRNHGEVLVNPQLKAVEFFRVLDAWQAYQELDMYLGALAAPDTKPPVQVADKDRIAQHGFDRQSFRKRPHDKT